MQSHLRIALRCQHISLPLGCVRLLFDCDAEPVDSGAQSREINERQVSLAGGANKQLPGERAGESLPDISYAPGCCGDGDDFTCLR